ncbi:hypothetical protein BGW38_001496 [Lunasporangiospora selenospora]|uniref:C2H2-type domain-containing protein n=1 Tax=Lunasporangiospora selenospora TaxID=979761 RepID=A0A9P6KDH3_9FUNG|nr:hypothetical protein BGW38_001496 [Lunasporangiospora selenospora]
MDHTTPTPASILASIICTPTEVQGYHAHPPPSSGFEDSDTDSSYSGTSSFSTSSLTLHEGSATMGGLVALQGQALLQHAPQTTLTQQQQPVPPQLSHSQLQQPPPQQQTSPQQPSITFHYFCNFPTCDYHSVRSDPVKRHRDTHYPDYKPYICNYCQSSSARRDSTREHCLKQHKDDSENAFRYDSTVPKPEGWIAYEPKRCPWPPIMV